MLFRKTDRQDTAGLEGKELLNPVESADCLDWSDTVSPRVH